MAYTLKQLTTAWTAVHDGIAPDAASLANLQSYANLIAQGSMSDQQALSYVLNSADSSTALAVLAYQFFTGKSPSQAGLDYLLNSATNTNDLNDAYYAKFGLENRYINFAANLGVAGEGAAAFAAKYGAMSFGDYVASIYETIIGSSYAKAAGLDAAKAIADITSRQAAILATARDAGMITPNMTQAQIDLAVKAATAGYLLGEAVKADVGLYAGAANNFMVALATGTAAYNTDITATYKPTADQGTGKAVTTPPATLPGGEPAAPTPMSLTLTTGLDKLNGGAADDTFLATDTTFNASDILNGASGYDILAITAATGGVYTPAAASVSNIEAISISNNAGVTVNTTGWSGVSRLTTITTIGGQSVTAATTTDITLNATNVSTNDITVTGGQKVTVTASGQGGDLTINGATGAVVVNRTLSGAASSTPTSTVRGGTTIDYTLTAIAPSPGDLQRTGTVELYGSAATTSVKVKAAQQLSDNGVHGDVGATDITIQDSRYNTTTKGTITTVEVNGYSWLYVNDSALTTLKASHGGEIVIDNDDAVASPVTTLNATLDDISGPFVDRGVYTTLNIIHGSGASDLDVRMAGLTKLTVAGAGSLTLTPNSTVLQTLTVTGSTNLTAYVDASVTTVTTGSGADYIDPGATISHAISLGAGNDTIYVEGATITATVNGGDGADTVFLDATSAASLIPYLGYLVNFERIHFDNGNNFTVDMAPLGYHYVVAEDGNGFTLNGMSSGDTLALFKNGISYIVGNANFGGASDSFNLALQTTGSSALAYGSVSLSGVETVAITLDDTRATPTGTALNTVSVLDTAAKIITISGDAGLELTTNSNALTLVDASGITTGDFTWTTAAPNVSLTVKGSAHGTNTFTINGIPTAGVTYEGGTGDDIVTLLNDNSFNVVHLGAGNNYFEGDATSVTAGAGDDYVKTSATGSVIDLGGGHNVLISFSDAVHYTGGGGFDDLFVAAGANVIDVGSGNDRVEIDAIDASSATVFTSITGMGAGDKLTFGSGAANNSAATTMGAQTTLTGTHTLAEYLDAASTDVAGTTNALHWFVMGSDLYIVSDRSDAATFVDGSDVVVKLVGAASLASTMGTTTVASALITFH